VSPSSPRPHLPCDGWNLSSILLNSHPWFSLGFANSLISIWKGWEWRLGFQGVTKTQTGSQWALGGSQVSGWVTRGSIWFHRRHLGPSRRGPQAFVPALPPGTFDHALEDVLGTAGQDHAGTGQGWRSYPCHPGTPNCRE
jgi:hypothetical protein